MILQVSRENDGEATVPLHVELCADIPRQAVHIEGLRIDPDLTGRLIVGKFGLSGSCIERVAVALGNFLHEGHELVRIDRHVVAVCFVPIDRLNAAILRNDDHFGLRAEQLRIGCDGERLRIGDILNLPPLSCHLREHRGLPIIQRWLDVELLQEEKPVTLASGDGLAFQTQCAVFSLLIHFAL